MKTVMRRSRTEIFRYVISENYFNAALPFVCSILERTLTPLKTRKRLSRRALSDSPCRILFYLQNVPVVRLFERRKSDFSKELNTEFGNAFLFPSVWIRFTNIFGDSMNFIHIFFFSLFSLSPFLSLSFFFLFIHFERRNRTTMNLSLHRIRKENNFLCNIRVE